MFLFLIICISLGKVCCDLITLIINFGYCNLDNILINCSALLWRHKSSFQQLLAQCTAVYNEYFSAITHMFTSHLFRYMSNVYLKTNMHGVHIHLDT